ncbi:PIR protein [Plasmodium ovale]|uniref:PIR protein n=1 Tax=Plasmodium ovale TaxID=36330 RepID=A0A1C3KH09_PLAOA|nr:PIR protein [Plasmodium ovale]
MSYTLDYNNFPSSEFDRKFKSDIEYEKLESFVAKQTKEGDLNDWIDKFKEKLKKYFNEEYKSWSEDIYQKRCTDLDYWVYEVKGKLSSLIMADPQLFSCNTNFQQYIPSIFKENTKFICERYDGRSNKLEIKKKLGDYCENRDYLKGEIEKKKNKDFCLRVTEYIRENTDFFNKEDTACKNEYFQETHCIIDKNCTIENQSTTFPQIDCNIYDDFHNPDNNSLLKNLLLTTPIILGIFPLFLFLYKYTPLSSLLLNALLKRKRNDFLTEDTYEMLEGNAEYSSQYTENVENSIGYHMISN